MIPQPAMSFSFSAPAGKPKAISPGATLSKLSQQKPTIQSFNTIAALKASNVINNKTATATSTNSTQTQSIPSIEPKSIFNSINNTLNMSPISDPLNMSPVSINSSFFDLSQAASEELPNAEPSMNVGASFNPLLDHPSGSKQPQQTIPTAPTLNPIISALPTPSPLPTPPALTTDPAMFGITAASIPTPSPVAQMTPMQFVTNPLLNQIPNTINPSLVAIPAQCLPGTTPSMPQYSTIPAAPVPVSVVPIAHNRTHAPLMVAGEQQKKTQLQPVPVPVSAMSKEKLYGYYHKITGGFLKNYYHALHSEDPKYVKNFYHVDAEIHRSRVITNLNSNTKNEEPYKIKRTDILSFLTDDNRLKLVEIVVQKAIHQKAIFNSILVQVDGIITLQDDRNSIKTRSFEQTFFVNKEQSGVCWLIQNDILSYTYSNDNHKENASTKNQETINSEVDNKNNSNANIPKLPKMHPTWSTVTASKTQYPVHPVPHNFDGTPIKPVKIRSDQINYHHRGNPPKHHLHKNGKYVKNYDMPKRSEVNKRMVNKFYHDTSYQQYDNNLAIFIKGIPKDLTDTKLCGILRMNIIRYSHQYIKNKDPSIYGNLDIDTLKDLIAIDYVDVNYHKQFAFVYLANSQTFDIALEMGHIYLGENICQIQRKQSHNGPRKFSNPHYNQNNQSQPTMNKHHNNNHQYQRRQPIVNGYNNNRNDRK